MLQGSPLHNPPSPLRSSCSSLCLSCLSPHLLIVDGGYHHDDDYDHDDVLYHDDHDYDVEDDCDNPPAPLSACLVSLLTYSSLTVDIIMIMIMIMVRVILMAIMMITIISYFSPTCC